MTAASPPTRRRQTGIVSTGIASTRRNDPGIGAEVAAVRDLDAVNPTP